MRHDTLLLSCGSAESRAELNSIFKEKYNILEAGTVGQTELLLRQNGEFIAAVLVDLRGNKDVTEGLLKMVRVHAASSEQPFVAIVDDLVGKYEQEAFEAGVAEVILMPAIRQVIVRSVETVVELSRHRWHLTDLLNERTEMLRSSNEAMMDALFSIIEYRSAESGQHVLRIRRFTGIMLETLAANYPEYELTPNIIATISSASALHDIGKIGIPDSILNKPGPLSKEEWETMKTHSLIGCRILENLESATDRDYLRYAHNICHYHHERWDGKGYPEGISGDDIPICAQVVGLADAYDALRTTRAYKEAYTHEQAVTMILNGQCGVFSPKLLECFALAESQMALLAQTYADGYSPKSDDIAVPLPGPNSNDRENSLNSMQLKYQALLHYMGATVLEVNFDKDIFRIIYNPDPVVDLSETTGALAAMDTMVDSSPSDREKREELRRQFMIHVNNFLDNGLRRYSYRCELPAAAGNGRIASYEIAMLRPDLSHRSILLMWKKLSISRGVTEETSEAGSAAAEDNSEFESMALSYCCHNDADMSIRFFASDPSYICGFTQGEIFDAGGSFLRLVPEDRRESVGAEIRERLRVSTNVELEHDIRHKNGRTIRVINRIHAAVDDTGHENLFGVMIEVSSSRAFRCEQHTSAEIYRILMEQTESVTFEWDIARDTANISGKWKDIFGSEPLRCNISTSLEHSSHIHPADIPMFWNMLKALKQGADLKGCEIRIARDDGRYIWCGVRAVSEKDDRGKTRRVIGVIMNIDADRQETQLLQEKADRDSLTKLLNKEAGRRRTESYLADLQDARAAMIIIDLDNFKTVNDRYGHLFGDAVLDRAASELQKLFRADDIIARIGGDEFMVVMKGNPSRKLIGERCDNLVRTFRDCLTSLAPGCNVSCSVGVAVAPENGDTYTELFRHADQALYIAKRKKNSYVVFDNEDSDFLAAMYLPPVAVTRIESEEMPGLAGDSFIRYAFRRLYQSNDPEDAISKILETVGKQMNVSRVYIFENNDDNTLCSNTFEWCNEGISPEIDNLQNISYITDIPDYQENFNEQNVFYVSDVSALPKNLYDILAPQGIKSLLHCAIMDNGVFRGYVGFDECRELRFWTQEQIDALTFCSEIISIFLLKKRAEDARARRTENLVSILDNQRSWIYVIDPDTFKLRFINAATKELVPGAKEGMTCYECLQNRSTRCEICPAVDIRENRNGRVVVSNEYLNLKVVADASLIRWDDEDACLLTCSTLVKEDEE